MRPDASTVSGGYGHRDGEVHSALSRLHLWPSTPPTTSAGDRIGRCGYAHRAQHQRFPRWFMAGSGVKRSWTDSSTSTSRNLKPLIRPHGSVLEPHLGAAGVIAIIAWSVQDTRGCRASLQTISTLGPMRGSDAAFCALLEGGVHCDEGGQRVTVQGACHERDEQPTEPLVLGQARPPIGRRGGGCRTPAAAPRRSSSRSPSRRGAHCGTASILTPGISAACSAPWSGPAWWSRNPTRWTRGCARSA